MKKLEGYLKLPEYYRFVSMLLVGYPDQDPPQRPRKKLYDIVIKN
jgi:nitroreductase